MTSLNESPETTREEPYSTRPDVCPQAIPTGTSERSSAGAATQHTEEKGDVPEVAIAIMGPTGSGKSTFTNLVSGSKLDVSGGLRSCTDVVQAAGDFYLDGRRVTLIDTPGFDDTTRSDTDVLKSIALFLETSYKQGTKLAGVLYFHRISDFKMTGLSRKNFNMFRKLCGDNTLENIVIVTNMWGEVDPQTGDKREAELMREDIFFKPVLEKGAKMARHENTVHSAETIIRLILNNHPLPLRIQEELVDGHMDLSETSAGEELNREINAKIGRLQEDVRFLKEEMEQARKEKDEQARRELDIEIKKLQREVERFQNDARRLGSDYKKEKERLEARLKQVESEGREEVDRIRAQYHQQTDENKRLEARLEQTREEVDCIRAQHRQQTEENEWLQTRLEQVESEGREEADRIKAQYQQQTDENERLEVRLEQAREEVARMRAQYQQKTDENERLEARLEQAREEVDRVGAHYQQQIDELNSALQSNAESSEQEKASLRNDIQILSRKLLVKGVGLLGPGGASIDRFIARPFFDHLDKWAVKG